MTKYLKWDDIVVGEELTLKYRITGEMIDSFARASEDHHEWFTKKSPFGGRIAHPTLTSLDYQPIMYTLEDKKGEIPGAVLAKQEIEFINPTRLGQTVTVKCRVAEKYEKRGRYYIVFEYADYDENGVELVRYRLHNAMTKEG